MKKPKVLVIDDDDSLRRILEFNLEEEGCEVRSAADGETGLRMFKQETPNVVITDVNLPGANGLEVMRQVKLQREDTIVIVITAYGTIDNAVEAMQLGAADYITKPFNRDELRLALKRALEMNRLKHENVYLRQVAMDRFRFENIIGESGKMEEVYKIAGQVAPTDSTVLLLGESGTGKELLAKAIHFSSKRCEQAFITVNCAAIPENLLESELFGHKKGAFTGAVSARMGKFEQADGGTIFLDEVSELRKDLQAKLLRVLQEGEIDTLGATQTTTVDVRVIAASNQDLETAIKEGVFREDLYYRLSVVPIILPPLRERRQDISLLLAYFLKKYSEQAGRTVPTISDGARDCLKAYNWPGNVRELENLIERLMVLSTDSEITVKDLPEGISRPRPTLSNIALELPEDGINLELLERDLLVAALEKNNWNQSKAARYLSISRNTLVYRMDKHSIEKPNLNN